MDENLDTMNGLPAGTRRRAQRHRAARIQRTVFISVTLVVAGASVAALMWDDEGAVGRGRQYAEIGTDLAASRVAIPARPPEIDEIVERLSVSDPQPLLPAVIPVRVIRIALDPGHGGMDGGTSLGYGILEKDLTKDIANRLSDLLEAASWEVVMTRQEDEMVSLRQRTTIANQAHADLFLSIHINWLPDRTARGFETYYLGPTDDPFLRRLAAAENKDSGFALADYRELLEGIYADVRHDQSRRLAEEIQSTLFETLREENSDIVSRGVMTAPFAVLVTTDMPAVLVEVACLSNDREARLLARPSYRQRIAEALFSGLSHYAKSVTSANVEVEKGS